VHERVRSRPVPKDTKDQRKRDGAARGAEQLGASAVISPSDRVRFGRTIMANTDTTFEQIDSKLTALLALILDGYLRQTGVAKPKDRTIDRILIDAGLSARQVAGLLGKTERAVHISLQREREAKAKKKEGDE